MNTDKEGSSASDQISKEIQAAHARLEHLSHFVSESSFEQPGLYTQMLEELHVFLQELAVSDEELREQNIQLVLAREELESEKHRYQDLFDFAPDGYLMTDTTGVILEANLAAGRLLNVEPRFLIGKPLIVYVLPQDRKDFRVKLSTLNEPPRLDDRFEIWEVRLESRRKELITASITVALEKDRRSPEADGRIRWLLRDVSQRKQIQNELKELRDKLVQSHERERQQLAHNLHEGPIQDLYAIVYQLSMLEQDITQEDSQESLKTAQNQLGNVIETLRAVCGTLRPPTLIPFGLQKAIISEASQWQEDHRVPKINLQLMPGEISLSQDVLLILFRIYQHAMVNAIRHANAENIWVNLSYDDTDLTLEIQDDGMGFSVPKSLIKYVRQGHYGLADMAERAAAIGGKFEIVSRPQQGTRIRVALQTESAAV